jgi:hypothetical protein
MRPILPLSEITVFWIISIANKYGFIMTSSVKRRIAAILDEIEESLL